MDWTVLPIDDHRLRLIKAFVELAPSFGVNRSTLDRASQVEWGEPHRWRVLFPEGPTEVLWAISDISDASMRAPYVRTPAQLMADVIRTRFEQNGDLKPFVKRVMHYDFFHPVQALARMQRTAKAMYACTEANKPPGFLALSSLNVLYTVLVFLWLIDQSPDDARTRKATVAAMRALGI